MRIVTWNVHAGGRAAVWRELRALDPDVALLQECNVPVEWQADNWLALLFVQLFMSSNWFTQ